MYLSKLEIFGFKSFAHKTTLQFNDGLTAIIGPNGCGKSNIVDSIRWVLGEQRTTTLRLDRMDSVIFNGTVKRKPLSIAEVSLFIENNKNILPSIYTEVKITRRLYRSGDSEYLINNRQVRLKDVIDLFTDTGMGSDAYSVIELKMVEQILSDNAEERRRLFEEASGIKKYKFRRKTALRKLETTQQELVRLNDVISEVQKNVNSLSRQVGKARRYHEYKNELRQNELHLFQLKIKDYEVQLLPLREEDVQIRSTRESLGKEVNVRESELEKLQLKSVDLERQFRDVAGKLSNFDDQIRTIQQQVQLNEQKSESLAENHQKAEDEIALQEEKITGYVRQIDEIENKKQATDAESDAKQTLYQENANRQLEAESRLESIRSEYQQFREENRNVLNAATQQREAFQRIAVQKNNYLQQKERIARILKNSEEDLKGKQEAVYELENQVNEAQEDLNLYNQELEQSQKQLLEMEDRRQPLQEEKNTLLGTIERLKSRKEFLQKLIESYEGFSESVQYVMARKTSYGGLIDTLANMVDTHEEYRPALESYLQEVSNYLIVDEVKTAKDILQEVRDNNKGRLTLVPLSLLNTSPNGKFDGTQANGELILLKSVVNYDSRFEPLFNYLFSRVLLVKDMDTALRWREKFPGNHFLTMEGEMLGGWGQITGGNSRQAINLTGRQQQFKKVSAELQKNVSRMEKITEDLAQLQQTSDQKKQKIQEFQKLQKDQGEVLNRLQQSLSRQQYEIERSQDRIGELKNELNEVAQQLDEAVQTENEIKPRLDEAVQKQSEFQDNEQKYNENIREAENIYREVSREVQELQIAYLNKKGYLKELDQQLSFTQKEHDEAEARIAVLRTEMDRYNEDILRLAGENEKSRTELDTLYSARDEVEKRKNEVETSFQSLKSVIMAREEEIKKITRRLNQALERLRELELSIKELEVKLKGQQEQMDERFGDELDHFIKEYPLPEDLISQTAQENISTLRQKIESLGEVNPLAIKEHDSEKERLDFLKSQQGDLLEAESELLKTISKLNKTARELFLDTFEKINQNFQSVFSKFFEGGESELHLVEKDDPLEANIDISVRIKGRRLTTLSLMSAGEKTLTAISLLFAIYLVKPSPFCILDEVDAPLDDVNIRRFTHALEEFSGNTQFILVTHNKMTMQAAGAMYGVTMEEIGVSKIVSVRFD